MAAPSEALSAARYVRRWQRRPCLRIRQQKILCIVTMKLPAATDTLRWPRVARTRTQRQPTCGWDLKQDVMIPRMIPHGEAECPEIVSMKRVEGANATHPAAFSMFVQHLLFQTRVRDGSEMLANRKKGTRIYLFFHPSIDLVHVPTIRRTGADLLRSKRPEINHCELG